MGGKKFVAELIDWCEDAAQFDLDVDCTRSDTPQLLCPLLGTKGHPNVLVR